MVSAQKVNLVVEKWSDFMAAELSKIEADCDCSWYQGQVENGDLTAFGVFDQTCRVGSVLTRIDDDEYVFVAGAGRADFDLIAAVVPLLEKQAAMSKCVSMRIHTRRRGMLEKAKKQGFAPSEIVLRKAVSYGR